MLDLTTGIYKMFDGRHIDLSKVLEIGSPSFVARYESHVALAIQFQLRDEPVVYRWRVGYPTERAESGEKITWNDMPSVSPEENQSFDDALDRIWGPICLGRFAPIHAALVDAWKEHRAWAIKAASEVRSKMYDPGSCTETD